MGDWSDCWLRVSAMEKLSLGSFLEESELMRDLDRKTSGVDERFLFASPINRKQVHRNKEMSHNLRYTVCKFQLQYRLQGEVPVIYLGYGSCLVNTTTIYSN
jgi:hypothetical protein